MCLYVYIKGKRANIRTVTFIPWFYNYAFYFYAQITEANHYWQYEPQKFLAGVSGKLILHAAATICSHLS